MSIEIRQPSITAETPLEQVAQIRAYLYQFTSELQWALNTIEAGKTVERDVVELSPAAKAAQKEAEAAERFQSIKSMIIKSADIVEAYSEKIESLLDLSSRYVAQSDFGSYAESVNNRLSANASAIEQELSTVQTLKDLTSGLRDMVFTQNGYIHYGKVGSTLADNALANETAPGIEVGDFTQLEDGGEVTTTKRFARFTAYGLELFGDDKDAGPVAYIKSKKLYITHAEITGSLKVGGFLVSNVNSGLAIDWVGV